MADVSKITSYVLVIGVAGIVLAVVLTILGTLAGSSGITTAAATAINSTVTAIATIPTTWIPIIIIVAMAGIILYMVFRFGGSSR